jgi:hypothetical protein
LPARVGSILVIGIALVFLMPDLDIIPRTEVPST